MRARPRLTTLSTLCRVEATQWTLPRFAQRVGERFDGPTVVFPERPAGENVIVIGGGTLIDEAKHWRFTESPTSRLTAIPSLWGSGAENSPVVVRTVDGKKQIAIDPGYLPDERAVWVELTVDCPEQRLRDGCGDVWAHALEALLSPIATDRTRGECAAIVRELVDLALDDHQRWFELSALACRAQSEASVGLVHGLAHSLESSVGLGHAALCSTLLWPVFQFNRRASDRVDALIRAHEIDGDRLAARLRELHTEQRYDRLTSQIEANWKRILRDPCTRTNCALVRPDTLSFFMERGFA